MSIHIQQLNSNGTYSYYYPDYASNSDKLDNYHASSFLRVDQKCTATNLDVYVNALVTYNFSLSKNETVAGDYNGTTMQGNSTLLIGDLTTCSAVLINNTYTVGATFTVLQKYEKTNTDSNFQPTSSIAEKVCISNSSIATTAVGQTINISNSILSSGYIFHYAFPIISYYNNKWGFKIPNADDQTLNLANNLKVVETVSSTNYTISSSQNTINQWINGTQKYTKSKRLLESI